MNKKPNYSKLEPPSKTPSNELCKCKPIKLIKIMGSSLFYNPIHCVYCNREIPLERLNLNDNIITAIAHWNWLYKAIDTLELDSGPYEIWANKELINMKSPINKEGLELVKDISRCLMLPCYYCLFPYVNTKNTSFYKCLSYLSWTS